MASTEDFGLSDFGRARLPGYEESHEHEHASLPKADGGKDAWLFLAGSFCIEALVWGEEILILCHTPLKVCYGKMRFLMPSSLYLFDRRYDQRGALTYFLIKCLYP